MNNKTSDSFDLGVIPRLILFVILPNAVVTPLRIFAEAVIEGKESAPEFITVGFLIYGICAKLVFGFGYVLFGYRLPVKNTVLRGYAYIMLILCSKVSYRLRHCSRKKQSLTFCRNSLKYSLYIIAKAHIKHFICFIKYDLIYMLKLGCLSPHVVHDTPRSTNYYLNLLTK